MNAKYSAVVCAVLGAVVAFAAEPWEDPSVNAINRLPARVMTVPSESMEKALEIGQLESPPEESRWVINLAGEWDFKWKRATSAEAWEKTARVKVPGCWQLQGDFDPPLYTNVPYPIEKDAPRVTKEPADKTWTSFKHRNPVGLYTTTFKRPWRWWFRRTLIRFCGVSAAFRLRVNGMEVGYSEDSRLPAEFDLSPYLKWFGSNVIEVEVYKHCDGTYLEDQDFWRLSGIFRNVYLVSEGRSAPFDCVVETKLSDDLKSGSFIVRDEKGNVLKERAVPSVNLWSPECPYVYVTPIENKWGWWIFGGTDYRTVSFGFRKVEIRDAVLYLNGKRMLFKGVNRHEMEPATGYAVTMAGMGRDVRRLKEFNFNAVRTCHYPDVSEWYDLCDMEGLMVCCEANNETHGYGYGDESLAKRADYRQSFVERGTRMVRFFRNHPSIVYWSMGNECGDGENFTALRQEMLKIDATRPIHYERALDGDNTDIMARMYAPPKEVERYVANKPKKPYILCEYAHAMGNSTGTLKEYWDLAEKYPSFQGGFVWDFADQAVWKTDARGKWLAYGGDFGDKPNDDNFNCNGIFDALRNPHPGAYEVKHAYQDVRFVSFDFATGRVKVRNDFRFKTLQDHECRWEALDAKGVRVATGAFGLGEVPPGEVREYALNKFTGDSVSFKVYNDYDCIAWEGFVKDGFTSNVAAGDVSGKVPIAGNGFRLNFWRAPTDNDRGWKMPNVCKIWKEATDAQKVPDGVKSDLRAFALGEGAMRVEWTLTMPKGLPPIPRVGLSFTVPKTRSVEYFGLGPWENYADRNAAAMLGVYTASVGLVSGLTDEKKNTIIYPNDRLNPDNYIEPGEQGYRTGCRRLKIGNVTIEAVNAPFGFNVWPYPQAMLEGKKHQWELQEDDMLTVNVDAVQMGVGGDNSWGARPHAPYMPGAGTYRLAFIVRGLDGVAQ